MSQARIKIKPQPRRMPSITLMVFAALFCTTVGVLAWTAVALQDPTSLPIRRVVIEGEFKYLDPDVPQRVVGEAVDGGFFHLDVTRVRRQLMDEPWIQDAKIRRIWPDTLRVAVVEQVPVARWGEQALLNEDADIFAPEPASIPRELARLDGPLGDEGEILRRYHEFSARLAGIGLTVAAVHLSARHAWTLRLGDDRVIELGRHELEARLTRLVAAYRRGLGEAWAQIGHVDLRYPNGFAVGARAPSKSQQTAPRHEREQSEQDKGDA